MKRRVLSSSRTVKASAWYVLKHGIGPGTIPKDVSVIGVEDYPENPNRCYVCLNRELTPEEMDEYDILDDTRGTTIWMGKYSTPEKEVKKVYFYLDTNEFDEAENYFMDSIPEPYIKAKLLGTAPSTRLLERDGFKEMII